MKFLIHIDDHLVRAIKNDYDLLTDELAAGMVLKQSDIWDIDDEVKILEKVHSSVTEPTPTDTL